jgi:hypothetical protein
MYRIALPLLAAVASLSPGVASARDPGPIDVRGRVAVSATRPGDEPARRAPEFNPAEIDRDDLHGPAPAPRERRRLYEEVEEAVDRGTGRIEDGKAHEARRIQDDRDVRLRRIESQREAERFEEENDRRRRLDQRREQERRAEGRSTGAKVSRTPNREPTAVEETPGPGRSALARYVAEQEELLTTARGRYQRDLARAEAERDAAVAAAQSRAGRAAARRRFEERRSALTVEYQRYRRTILGTDEPAR